VIANPAIAFGMPSYGELMVVLIVGLLIFGRRLPEVGRTIGKSITQLRRSLQDFKDQLDRDEDLRDAKSAVRDLERAVRAPRQYGSPARLLEKLTDEDLVTPGPDATRVETPPPSPLLEPGPREP
jgi:TatA/E family protein of Tat protein translocase